MYVQLPLLISYCRGLLFPDYKNALYSAYLTIYHHRFSIIQASPANVSRILTPDFLFDREAYRAYSKVYLPITYVRSYAVQFACLAALVTHTACWRGPDIWRQSKRSSVEGRSSGKAKNYDADPGMLQSSTDGPASTYDGNNLSSHRDFVPSHTRGDVHNRLMRRYEDAPIAWYLLTFIVMLVIGKFVISYYP